MPRVPSTSSPSRENKPSLWRALRSGNEEELKTLLPTNPEFVDSQDLDGDTPLAFAAQNMNLSLAKLLLQYGASASKPTSVILNLYHIFLYLN